MAVALVCILVSDAVDTGDAAGGTAGDAGGTAGDAPTPNSSSPSPSSNENESFAAPCTSSADGDAGAGAVDVDVDAKSWHWSWLDNSCLTKSQHVKLGKRYLPGSSAPMPPPSPDNTFSHIELPATAGDVGAGSNSAAAADSDAVEFGPADGFLHKEKLWGCRAILSSFPDA